MSQTLYLSRLAGLPLGCLAPSQDMALPARIVRQMYMANQQWLSQRAAISDKLFQVLKTIDDSEKHQLLFKLRTNVFKGKLLNHNNLLFLANLLQADLYHELVFQNELAERAFYQEDTYLKATEHAWQELLQQAYQLAQIQPFSFALPLTSVDITASIQRFSPDQVDKKSRQIALGILQYASRAAAKTSPFSFLGSVGLNDIDILLGASPSGRYAPGLAVARPASRSGATHHPSASLSQVGLPAEQWPIRYGTFLRLNQQLSPIVRAYTLQQEALYMQLGLRPNPSIRAKAEVYEYATQYLSDESFQVLDRSAGLDFLLQYWQSQPGTAFKQALPYLCAQFEASPEELTAYLLELQSLGFLEWVFPVKHLSNKWMEQWQGWYEQQDKNLAAPMLGLLEHLQHLKAQFPNANALARHQLLQQACTFIQQWTAEHLGQAMEIKPDQLLFEDVYHQAAVSVEPKAIETLRRQIAHIIQHYGSLSKLQLKQQKLLRLHQSLADEKGQVPFFELYHSWLAMPNDENDQSSPFDTAALVEGLPQEVVLPKPEFGPTAPTLNAAIQLCYRKGNIQSAVLHAVYPRDGRVFARFLHELPERVLQQIRESNAARVEVIDQGPFNANIHPWVCPQVILLPEADPLDDSQRVLSLDVCRVSISDGSCVLQWPDGKVYDTLSLGFQDAEARSTLFQFLALFQTGLPSISPLLSSINQAYGTHYKPRIRCMDIVLQRQAWLLPSALLAEQADFFKALHFWLLEHNIPPVFFAQVAEGKPQYIDAHHPGFVKLLERMYQKGPVWITEMMPAPDAMHQLGGMDWVHELMI
jgi:hypothetical protein